MSGTTPQQQEQQEEDRSRPDFSVEGEEEHLKGEGQEDASGAADGGEGGGAARAVAEGDAAPAGDSKKTDADEQSEGDGKAVKFERFQRVNNKLADTLRENEELKRKLSEQEGQKQPDKPAPVDIDALEGEIYEATMNGDKDKVLSLRKQVNAELRRQAEDVANSRADQVIAQDRRARAESELQDAASKIINDNAWLNPDDDAYDEDAQAQVITLRDRNIAKGMRPAAALEAAVKKVAPLYGGAAPMPQPPADDVAKARQRKALQTAAAASNAQPAPLAGGIGARGREGVVSETTLSDEQLKGVDKRKMFAGDIE